MYLRLTTLAATAALLSSSSSSQAAAAAEETTTSPRLFAYMKARNGDSSKKRTHVYALTTTGSIAKRFVTAVDQWRDENLEEPFRYNKTLSFPSPKERSKRVLLLWDAMDEFNRLAHQFFQRKYNKTPPDDHLFVPKQKFGPDYPESNQYLPTGDELNYLHEQFALLLGPGAGDPTSPVWGNWTDHLHDEMVEYLGYEADQVAALNIDVFNAHDIDPKLWQHPQAIVLRMYDLLEDVNTRIHATENMQPWSVRHRYTFNTMKLGTALKHELFHEEDYNPDLWHMAMEMGGLYMAYAKTGKNLFALMIDNDINSLKHHAKLNTIQFQEGFYPELYCVWSAGGNETEVEKRRDFQNWWNENDVSKYGFEWNNHKEPNGFIRLGQQVCDPPSDCDRSWLDLMDEFAETPIVDDIYFSDQPPYDDADLRYLYPGDDQILAEREERIWPLSLLWTARGDIVPPLPSLGMFLDDFKVWWYAKLAPSLPWPFAASSASSVGSTSEL